MTSPKTLGFNDTDINQIVDAMFDDNRTVAVLMSTETQGSKMVLTFTNKNPDGSLQTVGHDFGREQAAESAKSYADSLHCNYLIRDRSHEFDEPVAFGN